METGFTLTTDYWLENTETFSERWSDFVTDLGG
jgi:hypothetical protein